MKTLLILALLTLAGCATPFTITSDGKHVVITTEPIKLPLPQK